MVKRISAKIPFVLNIAINKSVSSILGSNARARARERYDIEDRLAQRKSAQMTRIVAGFIKINDLKMMALKIIPAL